MAARLLLVLGVVASLVLAVAAGTGTAAPPKAGCAANGNPQLESVGVDGWAEYTINGAVVRTMKQIPNDNDVVAQLFGPGATYAAVFNARTQIFTDEGDKNGDGLVCMAVVWGEGLNPNSHWAKKFALLLKNPVFTESFNIKDNNSQGAARSG